MRTNYSTRWSTVAKSSSWIAIPKHSGFKHRSFTEFFYAKSFIPDQSLVVDSRVFNVYWINTFFFYLGLRKGTVPTISRRYSRCRPVQSWKNG